MNNSHPSVLGCLSAPSFLGLCHLVSSRVSSRALWPAPGTQNQEIRYPIFLEERRPMSNAGLSEKSAGHG